MSVDFVWPLDAATTANDSAMFTVYLPSKWLLSSVLFPHNN